MINMVWRRVAWRGVAGHALAGHARAHACVRAFVRECLVRVFARFVFVSAVFRACAHARSIVRALSARTLVCLCLSGSLGVCAQRTLCNACAQAWRVTLVGVAVAALFAPSSDCHSGRALVFNAHVLRLACALAKSSLLRLIRHNRAHVLHVRRRVEARAGVE